MANPVLSAVMQKKIEGVIYDLMLSTNADNVIMPDGRTLAAALADYLTSEQTADAINDRIDAIVDGAPEAFDTLIKIAEYITQHEDVYDALNAAIGSKVDKEAGKGLSANDFTNELKSKLEALSEVSIPTNITADVVEETADRKFVTQAEKDRIAGAGRILTGKAAPADMTENDLFLSVVGDTQ